ncbi:unnamed protein product [Brassica oleracea var. botrytis]|nr:unnamed protein product [Brassica oleracea]
MKIHNAFCAYDTRRNVKASYWIHCRFQTWQIQRELFNMRGQAIRIQPAFLGSQATRQYMKRWRRKRQLFRRLQVSQAEAEENPPCQEKEGFHKTSQKLQDHYRRMKLTHDLLLWDLEMNGIVVPLRRLLRVSPTYSTGSQSTQWDNIVPMFTLQPAPCMDEVPKLSPVVSHWSL